MNNPLNLQLPTTTYSSGGASYTNVPLNMGYEVNSSGAVGCPRRLYNDNNCTCNQCTPVLQTSSCNQEVIYTINPYIDYTSPSQITYPATCYDNSQGYPATTITLPGIDYNVYSGTGIYFEQTETGFRINNGGIVSVDIRGEAGSGIIVTNTNTRNNPIFTIGVNALDLVNKANLVQKIYFNGVEYTALQGVITINSGAFGGSIQNINSPKNTILIAPASVGAVNIDVKPIKVNNVSVLPDNDGSLINFTNGLNSTVEVVSPNIVKVNVANNSFAKSVNSLTPDANGNINITVQKTFYQSYKTLTTGDITSLTTAGFDLVATTPTAGTNPTTISLTDGVMLYKNEQFIPMNKYIRSGSLVTTTGVTYVVGDIFTWIINKSS